MIRKDVFVSNNTPPKDKRRDLWGWLLFVISALFFIVSSIWNEDIVGLFGGVFFLLACVVFLAPYIGTHEG